MQPQTFGSPHPLMSRPARPPSAQHMHWHVDHKSSTALEQTQPASMQGCAASMTSSWPLWGAPNNGACTQLGRQGVPSPCTVNLPNGAGQAKERLCTWRAGGCQPRRAIFRNEKGMGAASLGCATMAE
jgi:hypothetical protein